MSHSHSATARITHPFIGRFLTVIAFLLCGAAQAEDSPVVHLELEWARLADPAGNIDGTYRNGITSGESAEFSRDGQYILTTSKSDGRTGEYDNSGTGDGMTTPGSTGATSHMRLWDLQGNLIWDIPRNPGGVGQPSSGEDEMEVAVFTRDDNYVAGAGDDGEVRLYRVRDLNTHAILSTPVLVKTFDVGVSPTAPNGTFRGIDSLRVSPDGDLLMAGNENAGRIDIFRIQGDPSTWTRIRNVNHGGSGGNGVNSVEISDDGQYVGSAGSNQTGGFWAMDVTRDGAGLITDVTLDRLASMTQPTSTTREIRFQPNPDNSNGERNELVILTAEHDHTTYVWRMQDLIDNSNPNGSPAPMMELRNSSGDNHLGTPPEPATFTREGRFLILTGKTRNSQNPQQDPGGIDMQPAFIRIYETAEIQTGAPEPDPVFVQREGVYNTEYVDVNPANNQLTSSHHDGSVRLWNLIIGNARTVGSEAFNELTVPAGRWTLTGSRSTSNGDNEFGITDDTNDVNQNDVTFTGHRGTRYVGVDNLEGETHTLTLNDDWVLAGYRSLKVQFAAAAASGVYEGGDSLTLTGDLNADGTFETVIAQFLPDPDGNLALNGKALTPTFQDFLIDLEPLLPVDHNQSIRFRLAANNDDSSEEMAFDSLRVVGEPIPPALDSDADGYSDVIESIAGTNPNSAADHPGTGAFSYTSDSQGSTASINGSGKTGRLYELRRSQDLSGWQTIDVEGPLAASGPIWLADPNPPAGSAFYRIRFSFP